MTEPLQNVNFGELELEIPNPAICHIVDFFIVFYSKRFEEMKALVD